MEILSSILLIIGGIALFIFLLQLALLVGIVFLIKKYPIFALFLLIIVGVIATIEVLTPATIVFGIVTWVGLIGVLIYQFKKLKRIFKK